MAVVARESLAVLALVLSHEQLEQVRSLNGRAAEVVNQLAQHIVQSSTRTALLTQQKERQAAEYEREGERLHERSASPPKPRMKRLAKGPSG